MTSVADDDGRVQITGKEDHVVRVGEVQITGARQDYDAGHFTYKEFDRMERLIREVSADGGPEEILAL